jgi:NAD(P)-dependent dehydrogenase (short-subunit alcohol dehydrogenase family)
MLTASDMTGKAVLVTGAASGLGRATALRLGRAGAQVLLVDVAAEGLEQTAREFQGLSGRGLAHVADLAVRETCPQAVAAAVEAFGRLDALCNVAGVHLARHTPQMTPAEFDKTLAVNLAAPFHLIQAAIPHLLETNGAVVNVTSCAAFVGQAYMAAYSATKAGLTHMTKSLAMEYINRPIRFNAVAPGGMMTPLAAGAGFPSDMDPALYGRIVPLRGMVEVDDVAEMVAFLATDAARGYHGACINIDAGITIG